MTKNKKIPVTVYFDAENVEVLREVTFFLRTKRNDIINQSLRYYLSNIAIPLLEVKNICDKEKCRELEEGLTWQLPF